MISTPETYQLASFLRDSLDFQGQFLVAAIPLADGDKPAASCTGVMDSDVRFKRLDIAILTLANS